MSGEPKYTEIAGALANSVDLYGYAIGARDGKLAGSDRHKLYESILAALQGMHARGKLAGAEEERERIRERITSTLEQACGAEDRQAVKYLCALDRFVCAVPKSDTPAYRGPAEFDPGRSAHERVERAEVDRVAGPDAGGAQTERGPELREGEADSRRDRGGAGEGVEETGGGEVKCNATWFVYECSMAPHEPGTKHIEARAEWYDDYGRGATPHKQPQPEPATCRETFGTKCCVLPAGHDGHHESRSGSCWGMAVQVEPAQQTQQAGLTDAQIEEMMSDADAFGHPRFGVQDSTGRELGMLYWNDAVTLSAEIGGSMDSMPNNECIALADHVRALAAECQRLRQEVIDLCMSEGATRWTVTALTKDRDLATQERDEARAEVERLRAENVTWMERHGAISKLATQRMDERDEAQDALARAVELLRVVPAYTKEHEMDQAWLDEAGAFLAEHGGT